MRYTPPPFTAIDKIIDDTLRLFKLAEEIPQMTDSTFDDYQAACRSIPGYIREGRLKIAVVGVIKSGKSTIVNSLVGKELVKRGAGVMTSITTRIRKGKKNQADLSFKSWDTINGQLRKALLLFPWDGPDIETGNTFATDFDIRRKKDRAYLETVYQRLTHDFPVTNDGIQPETLLIRHALNGFDTCKDLVQADEAVLSLAAKEFDRHKAYTSDPDVAFYVKDVCLFLFGKVLDPNIEIADCQGADSTDPASLEQVLTYLESSNLIVYCISSRIGVRQSDIIFLKQIKNLGLLDNILFVNNCDLTEHDTLDDLLKIENHIRSDLEFLETDPKIFSFSALYNLFEKQGPKLSKKEVSRFNLWRDEKKMAAYCHGQTEAFNDIFNRMIDKKRHDLLISNHLKRLSVMISELNLRADVFLDLFSSDTVKGKKVQENLRHLQTNASRLESIVANSIPGAVKGLNDEIENNIKHVFETDGIDILKDSQKFIQNISIDVDHYRHGAGESGFNQILYLIFQEFKRKLDVHVIETVKPRLKKFVQEQENRIALYFQSLFDSYQIDLMEADQYSQEKKRAKSKDQEKEFMAAVEIDTIKKILGLQLPVLIVEARYTPRIKAGIFTSFCVQTLSQIVGAVVNRKTAVSFSPGLHNAAVKIKKENQKIIKDQFCAYQQRLQDTYFSPLIEAATRDFQEKLNERFARYKTFKEEIEHVFSLEQTQKKEQKKKVETIKQAIAVVAEEIGACLETSRGKEG